MKASFAFGKRILSINPLTIFSSTSFPEPSINSKAFFAFCSLGYNAAIMYASSAGVDCFIMPEGETRISFLTFSEYSEVYSAEICPPKEDPIIIGHLIFAVVKKSFKKFEKKSKV